MHHLQTRLQQLPRAEGAHQAHPPEDRLPVRDLQAASPLRGFPGGAPTAARGHAEHGQLHLHHVRRDLPHEEQAEQARDHPRRDQPLRLPGLPEGLRETGEPGSTHLDAHEQRLRVRYMRLEIFAEGRPDMAQEDASRAAREAAGHTRDRHRERIR